MDCAIESRFPRLLKYPPPPPHTVITFSKKKIFKKNPTIRLKIINYYLLIRNDTFYLVLECAIVLNWVSNFDFIICFDNFN